MARRDTAARRYAEAAFQVAQRDDTLETWRSDLELAASVAGDERALAVLGNPALPVERRAEVLTELLGGRRWAPAQNLVQLLLRRGRIEELPRVAAESRRLDDQRQGLTHAIATSATPLDADEVRVLTQRLEQTTGGRIALEERVGVERARWPHRSRRRPPDRRQCPRSPRATPHQARLRRPLGDTQHGRIPAAIRW